MTSSAEKFGSALAKAMKGTFKATPERSDLPADIREQLVIALYSK